MTVKSKVNKSKLLFYIILIDILFFPYIRFLHVSLSMIILPFWYITRIHSLKNDKLFCTVVIFSCIAIVSVLIGGLLYPQYVGTSLVNVFILIYGMLYYCFFLNCIKKQRYEFSNVFFVFAVLATAMAIFYLMEPQIYFNLRSHWTMSGTVIEFTDAFYNRYTFIESDPNSVGPILCSMMLYILLYADDFETWKKVLMILFTGITVMITISATAVIVYCASLLIYCKVNKWNMFSGRMSRNGVLAAVAVITGAVIFFVYVRNNGLLQVNTIEYLYTRVATNIMGGTMSGRTDIWKDIIVNSNWFAHILFGRGLPVDHYGMARQPHNGHFYMIFSYGFIGYFLFAYIFFRKPKVTPWKKWIPLIPLLLLFSVNTLVSDYRALLSLALVSAICHVKIDSNIHPVKVDYMWLPLS